MYHLRNHLDQSRLILSILKAWRTEKDGYNLKGSGYITTE